MKNHKIGIITYHNAINYGAALQTYALNKYINNMGYTCETINYNCDKINQSYKLINLKQKSIKSVINSIINIPSNIVKKIKFTKFKKNNIIISKEVFNKNNITKTILLHKYTFWLFHLLFLLIFPNLKFPYNNICNFIWSKTCSIHY